MEFIFDTRCWDLPASVVIDSTGWEVGFLCFALRYTRKAWR